MAAMLPRFSRRSIAIAVAWASVASLAIGVHAALSKQALDAAKDIATEQSGDAEKKASRIALVIENSHYPDADAPLTQPINDARALTAALQCDGFDVDIVEDARGDDMHRAIDRLKSKIRPDSVVMLFFGGYGIQVVRREGLGIEAALDLMKEQGIWTVALAADGEKELGEVDLTVPTALVLGSEGSGVRPLVRKTCDHLARIPMAGQVGSLNVAAAGAVALYEVLRQRRLAGTPAN